MPSLQSTARDPRVLQLQQPLCWFQSQQLQISGGQEVHLGC